MSCFECFDALKSFNLFPEKSKYITAIYEDKTISYLFDGDCDYNITPITVDRILYFDDLKELSFFPDKKSIKALDLSNLNLDNIDFLFEFGGVQSLNLANNNISNLDQLQYLFNLKKLNLSNNSLLNLNYLDRCMNLEVLFLNNNNITELKELRSLSELKVLDLGSTQVDSLSELDELKNLEYIFVPLFINSVTLEKKLKYDIVGEKLSGRAFTSYYPYFGRFYYSYDGYKNGRYNWNL